MKTFITQLWSKILNNGVHPKLDFDRITQIRITNAVSLIGIFFAFLYALFFASAGAYKYALNDVFFIAVMLMIYLSNYLGNYKAGTILTFVITPLVLIFIHYEYGQFGTEYYFFSAIALCFYYYKNRIYQYLNSLYLIAVILLTKYLETTVTPDGLAAKIGPYGLVINISISLLLLLFIASLFIKEHIKNKLEIENKNTQLNDALSNAQQKNEQVNLVLKELSHRVKNNLQMVSSLFNIQAHKTKSSEIKSALKDARNRIVSIAIMHQKLYQDNLFHEVMLKNYILDLIDYLNQSVGEKEENFISAKVDNITLRIEDTVHIGLIINELVTNAIKYGVNKSKNNAEIKVSVLSEDNEITIKVADKGNGFNKNFNIENSDSFGLDLVKNIALQHEGSVNTYNDNGANVEVKLKITEFRD